ncbi:MAG: YqaA family protein [Jannaschia sp.]
MLALSAYGGLFLSALVAATVFPAQSEVVLVALLRSGDWSTGGLLLAASLGNVLGSVVNYVLGRMIQTFRHRRWFPASTATLDRARIRYRRYGRWSLLLSWVPVIGDPITVVAGVLKEPVWSFLLLVTIAKVGRYLVLAAITLRWI